MEGYQQEAAGALETMTAKAQQMRLYG